MENFNISLNSNISVFLVIGYTTELRILTNNSCKKFAAATLPPLGYKSSHNRWWVRHTGDVSLWEIGRNERAHLRSRLLAKLAGDKAVIAHV